MHIAIHEVKHYAQCYTWSQAPGSMLYMESSSRLNAHGVKLYA